MFLDIHVRRSRRENRRFVLVVNFNRDDSRVRKVRREALALAVIRNDDVHVVNRSLFEVQHGILEEDVSAEITALARGCRLNFEHLGNVLRGILKRIAHDSPGILVRHLDRAHFLSLGRVFVHTERGIGNDRFLVHVVNLHDDVCRIRNLAIRDTCLERVGRRLFEIESRTRHDQVECSRIHFLDRERKIRTDERDCQTVIRVLVCHSERSDNLIDRGILIDIERIIRQVKDRRFVYVRDIDMHSNRIGKLIRAVVRYTIVGHNDFHFIRLSFFVIQGIRFHRDSTGLGIDFEHVGGGSRDIQKFIRERILGIPARVNAILGSYCRQRGIHRRVFSNGNRKLSVLNLALVEQGLVVHGQHLNGHCISILGLVAKLVNNLERKRGVRI